MNSVPNYLDNASTTSVDTRVLEAMIPYFTEFYGNASSNHEFGQQAKKAIESARISIAKIIEASPNEIIFTSGSTESINLAIKGYLQGNSNKGNHIITVKTEHKAVLKTCEYLETLGYEVTYLNVDQNGLISLEELQDSIKENTALIAVMYVNNEIGIIQPIREIGKIAKENDVVFFTDATQAIGKIEIDVINDSIDMLCFSGHKLNAPKGVGILFKKNGIDLVPLIHGGGQEKGLRGGTYNTPLIVGLGKACEIAEKEFDSNFATLIQKRNELEEYYESNNVGKVNFKEVKRAPHIVSITLNGIEAEDYLLQNRNSFIASTGSACNSEIIEHSHVLRALSIDNIEKIIRISI